MAVRAHEYAGDGSNVSLVVIKGQLGVIEYTADKIPVLVS
jgi:hypothetical protein